MGVNSKQVQIDLSCDINLQSPTKEQSSAKEYHLLKKTSLPSRSKDYQSPVINDRLFWVE
jgi:hypothetical protein